MSARIYCPIDLVPLGRETAERPEGMAERFYCPNDHFIGPWSPTQPGGELRIASVDVNLYGKAAAPGSATEPPA